jgi:hypothetical protein
LGEGAGRPELLAILGEGDKPGDSVKMSDEIRDKKARRSGP